MGNSRRNLRPYIRKTMLTLAVLASLLLAVGNAYAWFIKTDSVKNVLKSPDLQFSFKVDEQFVSPESTKPGQTVKKVVDVKNTGDEPGFVRVLVLAEIVSVDGEVLEAIPGTTFTFDGLNVTDWTSGNTKMWANGGDGYYYYLGKLVPGTGTLQPLFKSVTLSADLPPKYQGASMKIEVKVEATETTRAKYRDGWWGRGDNPPEGSALIRIDDILEDLAKTTP